MTRILRAPNSTEILDHSPDFSKQVMAKLDGVPYAPGKSIGKSSAARRAIVEALAEGQGGRCYYCRAIMIANPDTPQDPRARTFDHIIPRSEGGRFKKSNGVAACYACNQDRGSLPFDLYCEIVDGSP